MGIDDTPTTRRAFLERTAAAGSVATLTGLAGCAGSDQDEAEPGEPLPSFVYYNNAQSYNPVRHDAINLIIEQLNEIGLDVGTEVLEWGTLYDRVTEEHDFDFATWSHGFGVDPARLITDFFHEDNIDEMNFTGYQNSEFSSLLDEQFRVTGPEERAELLHEAQEIFHQDVPMHPILELRDVVAYNNNQVSGWIEHLDGINYFYNMISIEVDNENNELVGSWSESIDTISPMGHNEQIKQNVQHDVIYDRLTRIDSEGVFDPETSIATAIERPDLQTVIAEIRTDHQWHDGEPLTAEDVAFTYNYVTDREVPVYSTQAEQIESATVIDDETVQINLTSEMGPFDTVIGVIIPIIPQHVWEDVDNPSTYRPEEHVGSGILEFDYWEQGSEISLVANEDHWIDLGFDRRTWRIIPELSTNWELLMEGELNYLPFSRPGRELAEGIENEMISVAETPEPRWWHCSMNTRKSGLDEVAVRKAVGHALPSEAIDEQLTYGFYDVGGPLIPTSFGMYSNEDVQMYPYDLDRAREVLTEAGFVYGDDGMVHYPADD